jgi:DNA replication protein DnaC
MLREYDKVARQCAVEQLDYQRYLLRITELELLDRERRATERRIRQAKFPVVKTMDSFDFLAIPSLNKALVLELARCEYVQVLRLLETFDIAEVTLAIEEMPCA